MRPVDDSDTEVIGWRYFNDRVDPDGKGDKSQVGPGKIDFIGQTEDERPDAERQRASCRLRNALLRFLPKLHRHPSADKRDRVYELATGS